MKDYLKTAWTYVKGKWVAAIVIVGVIAFLGVITHRLSTHGVEGVTAELEKAVAEARGQGVPTQDLQAQVDKLKADVQTLGNGLENARDGIAKAVGDELKSHRERIEALEEKAAQPKASAPAPAAKPAAAPAKPALPALPKLNTGSVQKPAATAQQAKPAR